MISSKTLKEIVSEARPIIERQLDDAEMIAGLRDVVAGAGGDWSALKALIKAQIQDERDETSNGKRVKKILDKAGFSTDYASLLGWSNMNEKNFSAGEEFDPITGEFVDDSNVSAKLVATVATGMQTEIGRKTLIAAVDIMIAREDAEETPSADIRAEGREVGDGFPSVGSEDLGPGHKLVDAAASLNESDDDAIAAVKSKARLANVADVEPSSSAHSETPSVTDAAVGILAEDTRSDANPGGDHVDAHENAATHQAGSLVESDPAIIFEACPRMPMKSLSYAHCFPELSKTEYQCLAGDIALNGVLEPIVRMGDVIVDGWNRYNAARSLGIEYPVTSYGGDDVLLDVIRWQRSSRDWTPQQERKIAAALAKIVPHRSEDIAAAFHLVDEEESA
ncbi:hypothetical protein [Rhizobium leguminosarum]|uniref:hypothetical protein n=1 Tax=Rhizobium leguminosarum TaxID=384 RepID=UPI0021B106DB|nr:hypothetical protein [Rhizobium leguminosarum]